jgi:1-deoxy-D-xylulose-5-phosphate synthase
MLDGALKVRTMTLPDRFIDHASPEAMYAAAGLTADDIAATLRSVAASGRGARLSVIQGRD